MDDSIQIRCTRCKSEYRDKARRILCSYSRQCPNCEVVIFFQEGSVDKNIQGALLAAQRLRRTLLEAEVENRRPISSSDCPETETRGAPMPDRFSYRRRYH